MNRNIIKILNRLRQRKIDQTLFNDNFGVSYDQAQYSHQAASDVIKKKLMSDSPAMICRFGQVELNCVLNHVFVHENKSFLTKSLNYINGRTRAFWWEQENVNAMCNNAGFFPPDIKLLEKYSELMLKDMKEIDVLGSWLNAEKFFKEYFPKAVKVRLPDLEPYYHKDPWTEALTGKTVLVIHPFTESITKQYANRKKIFSDNRVLPDFELKTIKAVQSIANNETKFKNWFEALNDMCDQISNTKFDIAIIGCGAYGFPLAAHVKRVGKKAVHMGGSTQILFGIKGKRWEDHDVISKLINENWIRPLQSEVPNNSSKVEEGCYW